MKILVASDNFLHSIRELFHGHDVELLPERPSNRSGLSGDILVFPGGEDINPECYGMERPEKGWFNLQRDNLEMSILKEERMGRILVKKTVGICRGHQLLNVGFGGSLVYDIPSTFGESHKGIHPVNWILDNPMRELYPEVNSMHHQGFSLEQNRIGDSYPWKVLGVEPKTGIIEAICWADKYLGVQFHPEFMTGLPATPLFVEALEKWVKREVSFFPQNMRTPQRSTTGKKIPTTIDWSDYITGV